MGTRRELTWSLVCCESDAAAGVDVRNVDAARNSA